MRKIGNHFYSKRICYSESSKAIEGNALLSPKKPELCNVKSVSWFTMSNTLERSSNKKHDFKLYNLISSTLKKRQKTASFVEKFFLKRNIFSNYFERLRKIVIGLYFVTKLRFDFLYIGTTIAFLNTKLTEHREIPSYAVVCHWFIPVFANIVWLNQFISVNAIFIRTM